jgi:hypothetical protein
MEHMKEYLTPGQVKREYHVAEQTLANRRTRRLPPAYHLFGRKILYCRGDIEAFLRRIDPEGECKGDRG